MAATAAVGVLEVLFGRKAFHCVECLPRRIQQLQQVLQHVPGTRASVLEAADRVPAVEHRLACPAQRTALGARARRRQLQLPVLLAVVPQQWPAGRRQSRPAERDRYECCGSWHHPGKARPRHPRSAWIRHAGKQGTVWKCPSVWACQVADHPRRQHFARNAIA